MENFQKYKREYDRLRGTYIQIHRYGVPVLFENMTEFVNWSFAVGAQYGQKLRRIDPDGPWSPDNCIWVDKQKKKRHGIEAAKMKKQWDEFITPIRERYFGNNAEHKREFFQYEHPDLVREGILWTG